MRRVRPFARRAARFMLGLTLVTILGTTGVAGLPADARAAAASGVGRPVIHTAERTAESSSFVRADVVRLITGDRVRVLTRADGSSVSTVLPGSPHAGEPIARWQSRTGSYVLPRTSPSERRRLDLSLFDVTAVARYGGPGAVGGRLAPPAPGHRGGGGR